MDRKQVLLDDGQMARQREFTEKIHAMHQARGRTPLALVDTFGCQQNVADSQHILGMLRDMGCEFTDDAARADIVVMNTCAIRDHAEKRVYGTLGALPHTKKQNPEQIICLCGCMAQRPEVAEKVRTSYRHVDLVFGPQALWKFPELLYQVYTRRGRVFSVENEHGSIAEGMPVVREGRVRAWVSIMYGCNNFCSYCIVPYVRGRERSRKPEKILEEIRALAADGCREIMLLGQNVNSYGRNLEEDINFPELLRRIDALDGDFRVRFMSPHPKDATEELFDVMANSRKICRSIHLPLQSGSNRILKEMNRRYTAEKYMEIVECARKKMPGLSITTDIIVGFPNETYEDFQETMKIVRAVKYDNIFSFIYSKRSGTKAALMEDKTSEEDKGKWFRELLAAQREISDEHYKRFLGAEFEVLFESVYKDGLISGKSGEFIITLVNGDESLIGTMHRVRVTKTHNWAVEGEIID